MCGIPLYAFPHHICLHRHKIGTYVTDVVEAHCNVVDIGRTDQEQICSRINNN